MSDDSPMNVLNRWLADHGANRPTDESEWILTEYRGVMVAAAGGGRRSNTLYVISGDVVRPCPASSDSLDVVCDEVRRLAEENA